MPLPIWLILLALLVASLMMGAVWIVAERIRNAGIVDIAWSAAFSLLAVLYAWLGDGYGPRRLAIAAMVSLWSLRLAIHLAIRIAKDHPSEDGRYKELRREWGERSSSKMFWFFQLQGLLDVALSVPFLLVSLNPATEFSLLEVFGIGLWVFSLLGESIADRQLQRFKQDPRKQGKTCQEGLWRYSRHPNYFFEWLIWCSYFVMALGSPYGWITLYCPALILYFLLKVTGIPATEQQALRSRGEEYRRYQQTTSMFVPWFPKNAEDSA